MYNLRNLAQFCAKLRFTIFRKSSIFPNLVQKILGWNQVPRFSLCSNYDGCEPCCQGFHFFPTLPVSRVAKVFTFLPTMPVNQVPRFPLFSNYVCGEPLFSNYACEPCCQVGTQLSQSHNFLPIDTFTIIITLCNLGTIRV